MVLVPDVPAVPAVGLVPDVAPGGRWRPGDGGTSRLFEWFRLATMAAVSRRYLAGAGFAGVAEASGATGPAMAIFEATRVSLSARV